MRFRTDWHRGAAHYQSRISGPLFDRIDLRVEVASESASDPARGFHRVLRVARTIADLAGEAQVRRPHLAEALSYRRIANWN